MQGETHKVRGAALALLYQTLGRLSKAHQCLLPAAQAEGACGWLQEFKRSVDS